MRFVGPRRRERARTHLINRKGCVARGLKLLQGARKENILHGSSTDEQRRSSFKDRQPCGLSSGWRLAALLLGHRALRLCSLVAPCQPPARTQRTPSYL